MNNNFPFPAALVGKDDDERGHGRNRGGRHHGGGWGGWRDYGYSYYPSYPSYSTYAYAFYPYLGLPQTIAAPNGGNLMYPNQYNPYYPYAMVGQDVPVGPTSMVAPAGFPGRLPGGFVPVNGYPVPALATNLPTRRVLGEVDIVETPSVALAPMLGIVPRTELLPGFKHSSKKIPGCGCGEVKLKTDLPFRIERLWVDCHDADKFDIKAIIIGQRVLSTGSHFPARYLKRGEGRHGFRFPLIVDIDQQHPLRILVHNHSSRSRRIRVAAWGRQLAE